MKKKWDNLDYGTFYETISLDLKKKCLSQETETRMEELF